MKRFFYHTIFFFGIAVLASCSNAETKITQQKRTVTVEVIQVGLFSKEDIFKFLGTVEANREMKLSFKIGGKIRKIGFEEGDLVEAGTILAELDTTELLAREEQSLEKRNKAKRDLTRIEKLFKKRIVSLASFQDSRSVFINAQADLKIVNDRLENSTIKARFRGRITNKLSEVGEIVNPGNPIGILTEMDPILVKAAVPDHILNKVRAAKTAQVLVDSYPQEVFNGSIHRIAPIVDSLSRTFRMKIWLDNSEEKLHPGLIAKVRVKCDKKDNRMLIPLDALIGLESNYAVFTVKDFIAQKRFIKIGAITAESVEVLEGLIPGELLVVSGQEFLKDGQKVSIEQKATQEK